jgi:hypothetical protein
MKYRNLFLIITIIAGSLFFWPRSTPWIEPPAALPAYPVLKSGATPVLITTSRLPPLAGYSTPKPVVAADPQGNVVVVAHGIINSPLGMDILTWRSEDRGESWKPPEKLTSQAMQGAIHFDPWLETDKRGHYYMVYAVRSDGRAIVRRTKDSGITWSSQLPIPWKHADRPVMGISPNGQRLVVAASMTEKAADVSVDSLTSDNPDPEAKLREIREKLRKSLTYSSGVFVSNDHGSTWKKWPGPFTSEHAIPFSVVVDDHDRVAVSWIVGGAGSRSVVSVSNNRGVTWSEQVLVQPLQPERPHEFNGQRFPVLATDDTSGLLVAYVDDGATQLKVRRSPDGKTWSEPIALSSKAVEEVRMAAIDACGPMTHVTWMERSGDKWHSYYRGSQDRGETWSKTLCLSESIIGTDSAVTKGFQIAGDDDQSSVRDDGRGRIHAVWYTRDGSLMHAVIEWKTAD